MQNDLSPEEIAMMNAQAEVQVEIDQAKMQRQIEALTAKLQKTERSADTARIAEMEGEVARLREAHGGSHSFTAGHGPTGEFVTLTFHTKAGRERFIDAHIAAIQAQVATTALGGQP